MTTPEQARRKRLGRWITWGLVALFVALVLGAPLYVTFGPDPPIRIGKETTHITSPLTPEGLPDYAAAMLADLRKGVTPENNGAVLFVQAMWDELLSKHGAGWSEAEAELVCEELGLSCPPPRSARGNELDSEAMRFELLRLYKSRVPKPASIPPTGGATSFNSGLAYRVGFEEEFFWSLPSDQAIADQRIDDLIYATRERPWGRDDLPCVAAWIEGNRTSLDYLADAAKRACWFLPTPGLLSERPDEFELLPAVTTSRTAAWRLAARAYYHLGERRHAEARRDIGTVLRFGHHLCHEHLLIGQLVGTAIYSDGLEIAKQLAADDRVHVDTLRALLTDLQTIGPGNPAIRRALLHERYFGLTAVLTSGRERSSEWEWYAETDSLEFVKRFSVDWNEVLVAINEHYDSLEAAFKQATPGQVIDALHQVDARLAMRSMAHDEFAEKPSWLLTPVQRGRAFANQYMASSLLESESLLHPVRLAQTRYDLTLLSVALAVWRAEHDGAYPDSLDDLAPGVLATLPTDAFGGGPYQYRRTEEGFLVYSVGQNGVDDEGSLSSEYGFTSKHEGIEIEVSNDSTPTPEEKALMDRLELIPEGADDVSVRFPLPVTPWPWEKASREKGE